MANCFDLAVPGRIVLGDDPVGDFRDDLATLDDDRNKMRGGGSAARRGQGITAALIFD
jgi:hypothetical protein